MLTVWSALASAACPPLPSGPLDTSDMSALVARIAGTDATTVTLRVPATEADEARRRLGGQVAIEASTDDEPVVDPPGRCTLIARLDGDGAWRIAAVVEAVPEPADDPPARMRIGTGIFLGMVVGFLGGTMSGAMLAEAGTSGCTGDCGDGGGGAVIMLGLGTLGTVVGGVVGGAVVAEARADPMRP